MTILSAPICHQSQWKQRNTVVLVLLCSSTFLLLPCQISPCLPFQGIVDNHSVCLNSVTAWTHTCALDFQPRKLPSLRTVYLCCEVNIYYNMKDTFNTKKIISFMLRSKRYCCGTDSLDIVFVLALFSFFPCESILNWNVFLLIKKLNTFFSLDIFYWNSKKRINSTKNKACAVVPSCSVFVIY